MCHSEICVIPTEGFSPSGGTCFLCRPYKLCHRERRRASFARRSRRTSIKLRSVLRVQSPAVPTGLSSFLFAHPPLKRWAIIFRPAGRDWIYRLASSTSKVKVAASIGITRNSIRTCYEKHPATFPTGLGSTFSLDPAFRLRLHAGLYYFRAYGADPSRRQRFVAYS
jgi:hypothetical protein